MCTQMLLSQSLGGLNLSVPGLAGEEVCCFSLQTLFVSVAVDLLWHSAKNSAIYTKGSVVEREIREATLVVTQMWELSDRLQNNGVAVELQ